jgi:carboxymethylenebutenolidase
MTEDMSPELAGAGLAELGLAELGLAGLARSRLARRGFVMSGLISGLTLAATRVEAQAIHTGTEGLDAGETTVPVSDGTLPAYYAKPNGAGPFPVVLVIEEIFGVHEYIKDVCRRLAGQGYLAVAPELYARLADLSKMSDIGQIIRDVILKAPDKQFMSDLDATATWAASHGGDGKRLAVTGFCRGGRDVWLYATHNPQLKAAVAWYGPVTGPTSDIQPSTPLMIADQLKCPLLGLYGGQDQSIKVDDVQAAAERAKSAHKIVDIVVYPDAPHGFHADYRPSYHATEAADGWQRLLAWFRKYGV